MEYFYRFSAALYQKIKSISIILFHYKVYGELSVRLSLPPAAVFFGKI
jgi:hypothetical protein